MTDQDRNILSNQLLILGFLRSTANMLVTGPIPMVTKSRKRKQGKDDEDNDDDDLQNYDSEIHGYEDDSGRGDVTSRGTILITLRNVPPYTLWWVIATTAAGGRYLLAIPFVSGICRNWPKTPHRPRQRVANRTLALFNSAHSRSIGRHGEVTNIV